MKVEQRAILASDFINQNNNGSGVSNRNALRFFRRGQQGKDAIQQKKEDARQKAMKLVKDVYAAEKSVDDDLKKRSDKVDQARSQILEASQGIKEIEDYKSELKKTYGIEDDSQEQKDLKLLEKRRDMMDPDSDVVLTEEDIKRLREIDKEGMTEYQKASLEADSWKGPYKKEIREARKIEREETAIINAVKLERLKSDPMVDATKQAEEIMSAANKEIIGMVIDEAKDTIDEKMEETKEDMQKAKEQDEELDEHIEEIQEKNEEMDAQYQTRRSEKKQQEELLELTTDQMLQLGQIKDEVQHEVDDMLLDMKLLAEDIKGSFVDTEL